MFQATEQSEAGFEAAQVIINDDFAESLLTGLTKADKAIPCRFLYDSEGSRLFEEITRQPEYYPTRTEISILQSCAPEIAKDCPSGADLIEFGSGSSLKTEILLRALSKLHSYIPIDISRDALMHAKARLARRFPDLVVRPIVADFAKPVRLEGPQARIGFFPGSTIGNLEPQAAVELLMTMRQALAPTGRLIIGADLRKDTQRLLAAYNDRAGVTAAFNRNVLAHANRALGTRFEPKTFEHAVTYDAKLGRIDMYLVSSRAHTVRVLGYDIHFREGERIHTEHAHKYSIESFQRLARKAGWWPAKVWIDPENLFSVHELHYP